jgi:hypothetical protein
MSIDRFKKPSFSGIALIALLAVSYSAQAADRWPRTFSIGYQKFGTLIILKSRGIWSVDSHRTESTSSGPNSSRAVQFAKR